MPLVVITGFPCSGKTYRAQQLAAEFSGRITASQPSSARTRTILQVPSQHSLSDSISGSPTSLRDQIYNSAATEKNARAAEFSNVKRALGKDAIIISDSLNYIKGYRYQLWCEAKAAGTRCCVLHVAAREDECKKWNRERRRQCGEGTEIEEDEAVPSVANGRGQDIKKAAGFGHLVPESHTALYGDRQDFEPRSRSSSMDFQDENGPPGPSLTSFSLRDAESNVAPSLITLSLNDDAKNETTPLTYEQAPDVGDTNTAAPSTRPQPAYPLSQPYNPDTLQSLILRYEPPSPFSRWDTPLFTIPSTDLHPPYDAIWSVLFPSTGPYQKPAAQNGNPNAAVHTTDADKVRPHAATVLPPSTSAQALQLLERTTAEIVSSLLVTYKKKDIGDEGGDLSIHLPSNPEQDESARDLALSFTISIPPGTILTQPMLQRLRRKFTQIQRGGIAHGQGHVAERGRRGVVDAFARFLEGELHV